MGTLSRERVQHYVQQELNLETSKQELKRLHAIREKRSHDPRNHVGRKVLHDIIAIQSGIVFGAHAPTPHEIIDLEKSCT